MSEDAESDVRMRAYYRARAPVYDRVYAYPERQADLSYLRSLLPPLFADRSVLEVAAGTGYWTACLSSAARQVTATDATVETLARISQSPDRGSLDKGPLDRQAVRSDSGERESVVIAVADAYRLGSLGREFDAAFAGLWFSHVPLARRGEFFHSLHSVLVDGSQVVLIDNSMAQCDRLPITYTDSEGNTYQDREMDDGSIHRVLKNFPDESALRTQVSGCAEDLAFESLEHFWMFRYRFRAT